VITPRTVLPVLVLAAAAFGCGSDEDVREPAWGYISPAIIQPNCASASCHSSTAAVAGLDLSTAADGYTSLTALSLPRTEGRAEGVARPLVLPGNPSQSRLINMLRATRTRRMPPDRPIPEGDIKLIEQWILNGAVYE
jgi:hypothetical protein